MLPLHVTCYIIGLPDRIAAFEALLGDRAARPEALFASGGAIVEAWANAAVK